MIELKEVRKFYGRYCALDGLDMLVPDGAIYGLIGPNGAGKTTTIRLIAGITEPDGGSIEVTGPDGPVRADKRGRLMGYVPDSIDNVTGLRVSEYMAFFASCYGLQGPEASERIELLLKNEGLLERADFYVDTLSRGMKQKLSLARALIHDPGILIMDEPTAGLDPGTRYDFRRQIEELSDRGKTVIISSHILSDISELCSDIGIINQGRMIMTGKLDEVIRMVTRENHILISLSGELQPAVRLLSGDDRVESTAIKGNEIMINLRGGRSDEAELLKKLVDNGIPVRGFARQKGSLETIFLQLTGSGSEHILDFYDAREEL